MGFTSCVDGVLDLRQLFLTVRWWRFPLFTQAAFDCGRKIDILKPGKKILRQLKSRHFDEDDWGNSRLTGNPAVTTGEVVVMQDRSHGVRNEQLFRPIASLIVIEKR